MALCLLSEILFEHKDDIREHLAALLHILTISLDSLQPILQQHAQQVRRLLSSFVSPCESTPHGSPEQGQRVLGL